MPLKGNKNSTGRPAGMRAFNGPLGVHTKKQTWASIKRMLGENDIRGKPLFSEAERAEVNAQNTGLNAKKLAALFHRIKLQNKQRYLASYEQLSRLGRV